jgi:Protein of unknown function (DUF3147)
MIIKVDRSALSGTKWSDYAVRFLFGGLITAAAGIVAKSFGPVVGGLFLAFPAIFPASATLIEKHEINQKQRVGLKGAQRAAAAVSVDAAGAAMGSIGLTVFALMVWQLMPSHLPWIVLSVATLSWTAVSVTVWAVRKRL